VILVAQQPHEQQPPMISASQKPLCRWTAAGGEDEGALLPELGRIDGRLKLVSPLQSCRPVSDALFASTPCRVPASALSKP
jgi:hypothetical protein